MGREDFLIVLQEDREIAKDILVAVGRKITGGATGDEASKCTVCDGPTVALPPLPELVYISCHEAGRCSRYSSRLSSLTGLRPSLPLLPASSRSDGAGQSSPNGLPCYQVN